MPELSEFVSTIYTYTSLTLEQEPEVIEDDKKIQVNISLTEEDSGIGIGHHGDAQYAVQRIIRIVFGRENPDKKILLNVNNYQEKRQQKLVDLANDVAAEVVNSSQDQVIHSYLSAHERFIVHTAIAESEFADAVVSESEGVGRDRRIVVKLK